MPTPSCSRHCVLNRNPSWRTNLLLTPEVQQAEAWIALAGSTSELQAERRDFRLPDSVFWSGTEHRGRIFVTWLLQARWLHDLKIKVACLQVNHSHLTNVSNALQRNCTLHLKVSQTVSLEWHRHCLCGAWVCTALPTPPFHYLKGRNWHLQCWLTTLLPLYWTPLQHLPSPLQEHCDTEGKEGSRHRPSNHRLATNSLLIYVLLC